MPAGDYLLQLVAKNDIGGCVGQWPSVAFAFCSEDSPNGENDLTPLSGEALASAAGPLLPDQRRLIHMQAENGDGLPAILAGGVFNTDTKLSECTVEAFALLDRAFAPDSVEVYYSGVPLNVSLNDQGLCNDVSAGDGIFSASFDVSRDLLQHRRYTLELVPFKDGTPGQPWPYLHVGP